MVSLIVNLFSTKCCLFVYMYIDLLTFYLILGCTNSAANRDMMSKIMDKWGYNYMFGVENIVGKGEIARYERFLLFPQCFQKLSVVDSSK